LNNLRFRRLLTKVVAVVVVVVETKLLDRSRVAGEKDGEALEKIGLVET